MEQEGNERGREAEEIRFGGVTLENGIVYLICLLLAVEYYLWVNAGPYWSAM
jgi:hypothetical protein